MIFTKITEQDLCSSPFLDKIPDWRLEATKVIQKSLQHRWLSVNFAAFLRKHIYIAKLFANGCLGFFILIGFFAN